MGIKLKIDQYFQKHNIWHTGLSAIRVILLGTELEEDVKWGMPTYRLNDKNVVSYGGFKNHFANWFHNGSFLKDEFGVLQNAQEGKTKGMRHIKYNDNSEVNKKIVEAYILEAIQNQKEGKEIKPERKAKTLEIPEILSSNLSENSLLQLNSFSNSKRNEYIKFIIEAKREVTKLKRIAKIKPMIESGLGLTDLYKST